MKHLAAIIILLLFVTHSMYASIIPRVGFDIKQQTYSEFSNTASPETKDSGSGFHLGIAFISDNYFLDISGESASVTTPVNDVKVFDDGWRSEATSMAGVKVDAYTWITIGYQITSYGKSVFGEDRGSFSNPLVGFSIPNMQQEDYLFSFGAAFSFSPKANNLAGTASEAGAAGGMRLTMRKKGSRHMWGWKHQVSVPGVDGFRDITTKLSYSYLFY